MITLPPGQKTVRSKWTFQYKYNANNEIEQFKAQLVAKRFTQQFGIDYNETFAPVIKMILIRILLLIAAVKDLEIQYMDVKSAFLNIELEEEIYLDQPQGFKQGNLVCKLNKSLYRLK